MKRRLLPIVSILVGLLTAAAPARAIILLGSNASAGQFPFMAAVFQNGSFICSGTVIKSDWVLTAGHCISAGTYTVRVGSANRDSGGQLLGVDQAIQHPNFDGSAFTNDAGLLHLVGNANVQPVALSGSGDDDLEADGAAATLAGWGDITPTLGLLAPAQLRRASVNIVGDSSCHGDTGSLQAQTQVCDSGFLQGQCNGDSGGAQLGFKNGHYVQIGIISNSLFLLCGYANLLVPEASSEVNAPTIKSFISSTANILIP
jgi:secreted trypsin-like serine protease